MVSKEVINNIISKSIIEIIKCHDYPKENALKEYELNKDNYVTEKYSDDQDPKNNENVSFFVSPIGELQQKQQDLQDKTPYDSEDKCIMLDYQNWGGFYYMNRFLNDDMNKKTKDEVYNKDGSYKKRKIFILGELTLGPDDYPEEKKFMGYHNSYNIHLTYPQISDRISNVIDKSPPLQQDTILYRYGEFPIGMKVGEHGKIKGFSSCSFNEYVATNVIQDSGVKWVGDERYLMKIHAPKGTKGLVLDENNFRTQNRYSEWLLDKNQKYIVLDVNDNSNPPIVDILLY